MRKSLLNIAMALSLACGLAIWANAQGIVRSGGGGGSSDAGDLTGQVALANGGTGANLSDPGADRILFWDDSASAMAFLSSGYDALIGFASGKGLSFAGSGPSPTTVVGGNVFSGSGIIIDNADDYSVVQFTRYSDIYAPVTLGVVSDSILVWDTSYSLKALEINAGGSPPVILSHIPVHLDKNNTESALKLSTPDSTDVACDSAPCAALLIVNPGTPTTRNFNSGIWIETNASAVDKGRGIGVLNYGQSDAYYAQLETANGTAYAAHLNAAPSYGFVVGSVVAGTVGAVLRGSEALDSPVLKLVSDDGDDASDTWDIYTTASANTLSFFNGANANFLLDTSGNPTFRGLTATGSAGSKKVVCVDTATGRLYASSTGTDCSN